MSGGFFRGTSAEQDTRFSNKQAKLLKTQKFAPELEHLVDVTKVKMDVIKPWIAKRVTELLGFEDEVLINFIYGLLEGQAINGKQVQIQLTGFMEKNTGKFMKELWALLISAQKNASGVPQQFLDAKEEETRKKKAETDRIFNEIQRRKEKETKEFEHERVRKTDGGLDDNSAEELNRRAGRGSDTHSGDENGAGLTNGFRGRKRSSKSPYSPDRSPSPHRAGRSRSVSKSYSNSRSYSKERSISRSISESPRARRQSVSPERMNQSPRRRSATPRRRPARESISPRCRSRSGRRSSSYARRSPSPVRRRFHSPARRRSLSPVRRCSRTPLRKQSPSLRWRRSPSSRRRWSPSPRRRRSPSPRRRRSPSPRRRRSPSPWRRSPSPRRRRSPSPLRRRRSPSPVRWRRQRSTSSSRSRSPVHRRRLSPVRRRFQSPAHHRSPSPCKSRSPSSGVPRSRSPVRLGSPSPIRRRSPVPARRRSPAPAKRRSPTPLSSRSRSPASQSSASPIRRGSVSPVRMKSSRLHKSPRESLRERIRDQEPAKLEPTMRARRQPISLSPQRDHSDRNRSRRKVPSVSPSPEKSPSYIESPQTRARGSADRRLASPCENPGKRTLDQKTHERSQSPPTKLRDHRSRRASPVRSNEGLPNSREDDENKYKATKRESARSSDGKNRVSPRRPVNHRHHDSTDLREKENEMRSEEVNMKEARTSKKSPQKRSLSGERHDVPYPGVGSKSDKRSIHPKDARDNGRSDSLENIDNKKVKKRSPSVESDSRSEGSDKPKAGIAEKRKHRRSSRREASDDASSESEVENRKETKRRRKEEKKLRKEERRRRREEKRRRREEKRASKRKRKTKGADSSSDIEKKEKDANASNGEHGPRKYSSEDEETESQKKRLEIELREKALESLRAKKGISR